MSQQQFPPYQDAAFFWIQYVQSTNGEVVSRAEEDYGHHQWLSHPQLSYSYEVYLSANHPQDIQYNTPSSISDFTSATNHPPQSQAYSQSLAPLFPDPLPSSPISTPDSYWPLAGSLPAPSPSSSASGVSTDVCRQAQPRFNEETQRWSCGGCNRSFSDKYGTERHIATVGLKVTCRYCGSQISVLGSSRRRHFRRESCRKKGIRRGFIVRSEEDAFIEGV